MKHKVTFENASVVSIVNGEITLKLENGLVVYQNASLSSVRDGTIEIVVEKGLTYDEICKNLTDADEGFYYASSNSILHDDRPHYNSFWAIGSPSYRQVVQLIALNKLMNVARYLNEEQVDWGNARQPKWRIFFNRPTSRLMTTVRFYEKTGDVYFDSEYHALQAIEILGEDTVKKALGVFE